MNAIARWWVAELILSLLFWAIYRWEAKRLRHPGDRYFFLCFGFATILFVPLLAISCGSVAGSAVSVLVTSGTKRLEDAGSAPFNLLSVLVILYFSVVAFKAWRLLRSFIFFRRLTIGTKGPVVFHDQSLPPVSTGFLRPRILLPRSLFGSLSPRQRRMVLTHERAHLARMDGLFNLLRLVVRDLLFFSPFAAWLARDFEVEMELSIDAAVLRTGRFAPREYGGLLVDLAERLSQPPPTLSHGLFLSPSLVKRRILAMKNIPLRRKPLLSVIVVVAFCLIGLAGVSALGLTDGGSGLELYFGAARGTPVLSSTDFASARVEKCDEECVVSLTLKPTAAEKFSKVTGENVGRRLSIYLNGKLLQSPVIKQRITGSSMMISGNFGRQEALDFVGGINAQAGR